VSTSNRTLLLSAGLTGILAVTSAFGGTCAEDLDGDDTVGFTDLTQLLGQWGPCVACPEDLDVDGTVGFTDLTQLLGKWGPCIVTFDCPSEFDDPELQQIGLQALGADGPLILAAELYDRLEADVTAIRTEYGLEGYFNTCQWVSRELLVGIDPEGPLENYEALNTFYGATVINEFFGGTIVHLGFACIMNMPALAAIYEAETEVDYAEANGTIGASNNWQPVILDSEFWQWTVTISFHDCFDGCDCAKSYIFVTDSASEVFLIEESPVTGQPWCASEIPGPPGQEVEDSWAELCNYN
jgi:hypothetical protein